MNLRDKWLAERRKGIGGSDAAAILGASPYKTNVQLWEEKTGRTQAADISDKPFVQYGKQAEAHLRGLFELENPQYIVHYDEFAMLANFKPHPWLFATLDGELTEMDASNRKGVLEIKTTEIMRRIQWQDWEGRVPQHYYVQVLHQLLATQYDFAVLMAQIKAHDRGGEVYYLRKLYRFEREEVEADMNFLLDKEAAFWDNVINDKRPSLILPEI